MDECENNPCENGGMCMDMPGNFLCGCPMGRNRKNIILLNYGLNYLQRFIAQKNVI